MTAKPRCVLVDDDDHFREMIGSHLRQQCPNFEVIGFFSSLEAFEYLVRQRADLIITESRMPFLDGLRLTAALRARNHAAPILIMSQLDVSVAAQTHGATAFISKQQATAELDGALQRLGILAPVG